MRKISTVGITLASMLALAGTSVAYAASTYNSQVTQAITAGVLSTDVRDASNVVVASPSFAMTSVAASTSIQTATGTLGTNAMRLSVDNPNGGGATGWTLTLNATTPGTGTWTSGGNSYPYNGTSTTGQLTVNPSVGTIAANTGGTTGVTAGSSAAFTSTTPITLMSAGSTAAKIWNGYITGIGLSQVVPAGQAVGTYTLNLTQTVAAV